MNILVKKFYDEWEMPYYEASIEGVVPPISVVGSTLYRAVGELVVDAVRAGVDLTDLTITEVEVDDEGKSHP